MAELTYKSLTDQERADVEAAFERLIDRGNEIDAPRTKEVARRKLERVLYREDVGEEVRKALQLGARFIEIVEDGQVPRHDFDVALCALEYLADPWDVIPDDVPGYGLADDGYVFLLAADYIGRGNTQGTEYGLAADDEPAAASNSALSSEEGVTARALIEELPEGAGQHFAGRAKALGCLNGYMRKALYDIGRRSAWGEGITSKQHAFFASIMARLVQEGMAEVPCPNDPCEHCEKLQQLISAGRFA